MSGSNHEEFRLMSLITATERVTKRALNLEQVLSLAMNGQVRLYAKLPPNVVAHVDPALPLITRRHSSLHSGFAMDLARYSPRFGDIHPEVTHVALDPDQAEDLINATHSSAMAFSSGLTAHPDTVLSEDGWLVTCQFRGSLVICPTDIEGKHQTVKRKVLKSNLEDILVDERVLDLLDGSQGTRSDDPYVLRERSFGMYVLYCAAKRYYASLKAGTIGIKVVENEVLDRLQDLGKTRANHVARLIIPPKRRNSGVPKELQKPLGEGVLNQPEVRKRYLQDGFITDALALALHVTEQWLEQCTPSKDDSSWKSSARTYLETNFGQVGFYAKQSKALARVAMWPHV